MKLLMLCNNAPGAVRSHISGKPESAELRKILAKELNLPIRISANAMLDIINKTIGREKYKAAVNKINQTKNIK